MLYAREFSGRTASPICIWRQAKSPRADARRSGDDGAGTETVVV